MCMGSLAPYRKSSLKKEIPNSLDLEPHTCTNMVILAQAPKVLHPTWGSCAIIYIVKTMEAFS